ncbi:hypothetical protein [Tenacibaculum sp. M341]|uniref:hypothetical protein n=1 Tax=Tenacibaculum sp. M341 TaxID=2530339 RepID=UPI0010435D24|nr:hypothetical protein [Tenacibaculum sp. M341]TCI84402.1 hypothetical protein EYW44_21560 [Tenacibaculum sp. M341]
MKKVFLLSFAFLFVIACSSNNTDGLPDDGDTVVTDGNNGSDNDGSGSDNDNTTDKDVIIGTWTLYLGTDQREVDECLKKTTFIFNEDKSLTYTEYNIDNNTCVEVTDNGYKGEWINNDNGTYNIRRHGFTSGQDIDFTFENNNNNMILVGRTYKRN